MAHSGKHRYKSRREKYERNLRIGRILAIFFAIGILMLIFKNRWDIYIWIKTYVFGM